MIKIRNQKWAITAKNLFIVQKRRRELEVTEQHLVDRLRELSKQESAYNNEFTFKKHKRVGVVDYSAIVDQFKIDVRPFRKDPIFWWKLSENKELGVV